VAANHLLQPDAGFIPGGDFLIDDGFIAVILAEVLPSPRKESWDKEGTGDESLI
jgi:hypothetical protein